MKNVISYFFHVCPKFHTTLLKSNKLKYFFYNDYTYHYFPYWLCDQIALFGSDGFPIHTLMLFLEVYGNLKVKTISKLTMVILSKNKLQYLRGWCGRAFVVIRYIDY